MWVDQDRQKSSHGGLASTVWILGSVGLFLLDERSPHLFSLQALVFIVVGMFVAAIAVGNLTYFLQTRVAHLLVRNMDPKEPIDGFENKVRSIGFMLLFVDIVIAALFVFWVYYSLYLM